MPWIFQYYAAWIQAKARGIWNLNSAVKRALYNLHSQISLVYIAGKCREIELYSTRVASCIQRRTLYAANLLCHTNSGKYNMGEIVFLYKYNIYRDTEGNYGISFIFEPQGECNRPVAYSYQRRK